MLQNKKTQGEYSRRMRGGMNRIIVTTMSNEGYCNVCTSVAKALSQKERGHATAIFFDNSGPIGDCNLQCGSGSRAVHADG